jgi:hypothetical protein
MRRTPTNTPLQALVTLNDEAYVECAAGLADRMMAEVPLAAESTDSARQRIAWAYRAATGRAPPASTLHNLVRLYENALRHFLADQKASSQLGESPEHAALAVVASAILNLDEILTK